MKPRIFLAAALALAASSASAGTVIATAEVNGATILVDGQGMSLYTFDKDAPGVSNCNGDCADKWPPLLAASGARAQGDFDVIRRPGGAYGGRQWTYKGMPLYTWVNDAAPGDTSGDGINGVWHLARP